MAPGATTKKKINKKIKNKEKTSVKYIALPATVPSGLKN